MQSIKSEKEQEADHYARIYLHQDKVIQIGKQFEKYLNSRRLNQICEQTEVSIPVALGILQHFKLLDWRQFSRYKEQVKELIPSELVVG